MKLFNFLVPFLVLEAVASRFFLVQLEKEPKGNYNILSYIYLRVILLQFYFIYIDFNFYLRLLDIHCDSGNGLFAKSRSLRSSSPTPSSLKLNPPLKRPWRQDDFWRSSNLRTPPGKLNWP